MKFPKNLFISLSALALASSASAAAVFTADFTGGVYTDGVTSFTVEEAVTGLAGVDTAVITIFNPQSGGASTFDIAGDNGIAIDGGDNNSWFDSDSGGSPETFDLTLTLYSGGTSGTIVTSSFESYITASKARRATGTSPTVSMAGGTGTDSVFSFGSTTDTLSSDYRIDGNTITFTSVDATAAMQLQTLTFNVIPEPSSFAALLGVASLAMLTLRRRR